MIKNVSLEKFKLSFLKTTPYFTWLKNYKNTQYIAREDLSNVIKFHKIKNYLIKIIKSKNNFMFLVRDKYNTPIGTIKIGHIDWYHKRGELGILIDQTYQGNGYGAQAASLLIDYSFKNLKLNKITGGCISKNIAMKKIFLKNKFKKEGFYKNHTFFNKNFVNHVSYGLLNKKL
jgi:RimJ/RimL family protein N-acetyltransferase